MLLKDAIEQPSIADMPNPIRNRPYEQIFCHLPESRTYYRKSISQAINAVNEFLNREHPFTGTSVKTLRQRLESASVDHPDGVSLHEALEEVKELYLNDAISFHHPKYVAHLNCPVLIPTLAAEVIASAVNTSMDTWDQSAGGTFIELKLIEWTLRKMGYPVNADGVFTSGGTQSNLMGLLLARDHFVRTHYNIDPKISGLPQDASRFRIFCSKIGHFSLKKNASLLGLGQRSIVPVEIDGNYRMDVEELSLAIAREKEYGNIPIAIVGTAGTTDFGSMDPLKSIAKVALLHGLWFHVDAAYGGGLLLSQQHCNKLKGMELSDSATIDYHKTFFQPVSSSGFFMRDRQFINYISYYADYLNSKDQEADGIPNMVKKSIQTTRRFDALKLWLTLKVTGQNRLEEFIDMIISLAKESAALLNSDDEFEVLNNPETSAVVFRYAPAVQGVKLNVEQYNRLNAYIRTAMFNEGKALIASTKVDDVVYLKFTLLNPLTQLEDIKEIIKLIKTHGATFFKNN